MVLFLLFQFHFIRFYQLTIIIMYTLDEIIIDGISNKHLTPADLVEFLPAKTVREISNRWNDALDPNLKKSKWTVTEGNSTIYNIYNIFYNNY